MARIVNRRATVVKEFQNKLYLIEVGSQLHRIDRFRYGLATIDNQRLAGYVLGLV